VALARRERIRHSDNSSGNGNIFYAAQLFVCEQSDNE